jgi:hypothetical protein
MEICKSSFGVIVIILLAVSSAEHASNGGPRHLVGGLHHLVGGPRRDNRPLATEVEDVLLNTSYSTTHCILTQYDVKTLEG